MFGASRDSDRPPLLTRQAEAANTRFTTKQPPPKALAD
jgi:hypothetical protein